MSEPPLKIAGVDPELGFAGGETQVLGLSRILPQLGHQVELLCDPRGALWARAGAAGVACRPLAIRNALDWRAGLRLRRLCAQAGYDVVHFHTSRAHALAPFVRGLGSALVVTRRMDYVPNRLFAPWLYNRAVDGVAAISHDVARALCAGGVDQARITVIPSGVDLERFRPPDPAARAAARARFNLAPDQLAIGALGALEPRKGHRYLIDAMVQVTSRLRRSLGAGAPRLKCLIGGAGPRQAALSAQIAALGSEALIELAGGIADPRELFWALDVYAHPSLKEGLGVALLEAMACGLPAVASRAGGMVEIIEDRVSGRLVEAADAAGLSAALDELIAAAPTREAMGKAARQRIAEHFSLQAMAAQTLALYRRILETRSWRKTAACGA